MANPLKIANVFLVTGAVLVAVSFLISQVFLSGTGFKAEYQKRQLQQCLDRHTPAEVCLKSFGPK